MPWNPATGMFENTPSRLDKITPGPGMFRGGGYSSQHYANWLKKQENPLRARASGLADRYDTALGDIEGTVGRFSGMYEKVANALSAPAMRDFSQHSARVGANAASRFGGNISSEELRQGYNEGDLFTRNLSEALSRLGGEQVAAGLNYTGQLGQAAGQAAGERERLQALILQGIARNQGSEKKSSNPLDFLGSIGGALSNFLGPISVGF